MVVALELNTYCIKRKAEDGVTLQKHAGLVGVCVDGCTYEGTVSNCQKGSCIRMSKKKLWK